MKPISFPWQQGGGQNGGTHEDYTMPLTKNQTVAIAFSCKDSGCDAGEIAPTLRSTNSANYSNPKPGDPCHPLEAGAHPPAVAFNMHKSGNSGSSMGVREGMTDCLRAFDKSPFAVQTAMQVRRLTPRECERLQGFPDDYTLIPISKRSKKSEAKELRDFAERTGQEYMKWSADGPRYKALGNSMAVPVMRWIGERIQMVAELSSDRETARNET
jgi:DNA (cytosine-5)-methyltransferase 1